MCLKDQFLSCSVCLRFVWENLDKESSNIVHVKSNFSLFSLYLFIYISIFTILTFAPSPLASRAQQRTSPTQLHDNLRLQNL